MGAYSLASTMAEEVLSAIRTVMAFNAQFFELRYENCLINARKIGFRKDFIVSACSGIYLFVEFVAIGIGFCTRTPYMCALDAEALNNSYVYGKDGYTSIPWILIIIFIALGWSLAAYFFYLHYKRINFFDHFLRNGYSSVTQQQPNQRPSESPSDVTLVSFQPTPSAPAEDLYDAARSEYEQAFAQAQRAAERLGQLSGVQPQFQFSGFSQASGQQQGYGSGDFNAQQQGYSGFNTQQPQQQCQGQCPLQPQQQQKQVQFGGFQQQQQRLTPTNSSYGFEQSGLGAACRTFDQAQHESVYIGMPNNLYLASNRPRDYHFQQQRQGSNTNLLRTARESSSGTKLRASSSDENIRTAVLNEEGKVVGVVETRQAPSSSQGQQQQVAAASSSDYHFNSLRELNSAY